MALDPSPSINKAFSPVIWQENPRSAHVQQFRPSNGKHTAGSFGDTRYYTYRGRHRNAIVLQG